MVRQPRTVRERQNRDIGPRAPFPNQTMHFNGPCNIGSLERG